MYDRGDGVPQNDAEALKWYRKAAEQGYAKAQGRLGFMYGTGRGVPRNYDQAYMWLILEALRLPSGRQREDVVSYRDKIAKHMKPAQIAKAKKLAREWKPNK